MTFRAALIVAVVLTFIGCDKPGPDGDEGGGTAVATEAIGLTYRNDARCDGRANCEVERAAFTFKDALGRERAGEVIDVHLACQ